MAELVQSLMGVSVLVFTVTSMAAVGLAHTLGELVSPLRNVRRVVRALVANFVLVPLLALGIARMLALDEPFAVGLVLLATAAGAPFLIKLTQVAAGDLAMSSRLLVLLLPITVVVMPILVPLAAPGIAVSGAAIARELLVAAILPLIVGLVIRERAPRWAARLRPIMGAIASVALPMLLVTTVLANLQAVLGLFGSGAIAAVLLLLGGAFYIGYLLGGPDADFRTVLGLGTAQRSIAAATVVATQNVGDPETTSMVVVGAVGSMAVLFPIARLLRKQQGKAPPAELAGASA